MQSLRRLHGGTENWSVILRLCFWNRHLIKEQRDEKERELYFLREKSIKDEISALANAEEKGIEKGIQQEKIDTVLRLNSIGLDIEQISKGTDIDLEEVKKIISNKS